LADNLTTSTTVSTIPAATIIATDQLATGEHVQYGKLMDGTLDGTTKVVATTGAPSASAGALVTRPLLYDAAGVAIIQKAASTAAVAADPSLVVSLSPNSPVPPGANTIGAITNTNLDVALSTRLKPADTLAGVTTVTAVTAITNALPTGTNTLGSVKLTDGTNVGTVKAASTAPIATDTSVVVTQSPNSPGTKLTDGTLTLTLKALPTGGSGLTAVPVYTNAIQAPTYTSSARAVVTGALVANTAKQIISFEKTNAAKTVKIRRIIVSGYQSTALAGLLEFQLNRGSAASSGGTAATVNGGPRVNGDAATICTLKSLPTIVAATLVDTIPGFVTPTAVATGFPFTPIFDWQEAGETKPWTLVSGSIDSLVLSVISTAAQNWTLSFHIVYTEE
jgi:hypothetical protein